MNELQLAYEQIVSLQKQNHELTYHNDVLMQRCSDYQKENDRLTEKVETLTKELHNALGGRDL